MIPGKPDTSHLIHYTEDEAEADRALPPETKTNRFTELLLEAHDYAQQRTNPVRTNWVELTFIWY